MASTIQFYRNFQALMRDHGLRHVKSSTSVSIRPLLNLNSHLLRLPKNPYDKQFTKKEFREPSH